MIAELPWTLPHAVAGTMVLALNAYVLLGGADFGGGFSNAFGSGLGGFDGGFGSGNYGFGDSGVRTEGEAAGVPSRFRYQAMSGGGAAAQSGFSRPPGGSGAGVAPEAAAQSGFGALASLLAASPFLATMLGKFGKKRGEE